MLADCSSLIDFDGVQFMKHQPLIVVREDSKKERHYQGIAAAPGILEGKIMLHLAMEQSMPLRKIQKIDIASEMERFEKALRLTQQELLEIKKHVIPCLDAHEAALFDAHLLVLEAPDLL